ncbi:hypothetical protein B0H16DRAFT_1481056 [Mycena metata]|uniref:Uncharacterized protein n=1 Tax=Mycena metata TaxID=1033252 RepID=A0AAD7H0Y6_9AGAR|nr:hypothetical protein B0H16DRAFT_1481056 [Mycena metata]
MRAAWPRHGFHDHGKCAALNDAGALVLTGSRAANRTLRAVQTISLVPTTSLALPPPPSVSWTPGPSNARTSASRSTSILPSPPFGWARPRHGRAAVLPSSRPSLPPPYSSPPRLNDTPMPSPFSSPPLSGGPQDKPMRMNTGFKESRRQWKEKQQVEAEQRARTGAAHEARAAMEREAHTVLSPRRIASVEITRAPSAGVVVGFVPKPEPDSDPELDGIIKREATTASPRAPLFDPNSSDEDTGGSQRPSRYTGPFRLTMQRRDEAEAFRLAGFQRNPAAPASAGPAPHGAQPTSALLHGAQPTSALPRSAQPTSALLRGAQPSSPLLRGAHPSPAPSRSGHPTPVSPPHAAQLSSRSISVTTSSALPRLDFTRLLPHLAPPPPYCSPPTPAVPQRLLFCQGGQRVYTDFPGALT